jgi:hypothetical protein
MVYFFIEYYVRFLVDERKVRWGAEQSTELNRLQSDLLSQLTCLPLKIALRGRAQWFYSVWDPLRYIIGSQKLSVIGMGKVWRLTGELIDAIALDGSILEDRKRCESFFLVLVPDVAEWRAKKLARARYRLPVEKIYEVDETDVLMASYHSHTADGQKTKYLAMCSKHLEGGEFFDPTDRVVKATHLTLVKNCPIESLFAFVKYVVVKIAPGISVPAGQAIALAQFNKLFEPDGIWHTFPDDWKEVIFKIVFSRVADTIKMQAGRVQRHVDAQLDSRSKNRARDESKEAARILDSRRLSDLERVDDEDTLHAKLAALKKKHSRGSKGACLLFLKAQLQIRTKLLGIKDLDTAFSVKDLTKKSGRRDLNVEELTSKVIAMISQTIIADLQLAPDVLTRHAILDDTVLPRTVMGQELVDAQLRARKIAMGIVIVLDPSVNGTAHTREWMSVWVRLLQNNICSQLTSGLFRATVAAGRAGPSQRGRVGAGEEESPRNHPM